MKPIRCCIVCKKRKNKEEYFRIVSDMNKNAILDKEQNINSRGIYICKNKICFSNIKKVLAKDKLKLKITLEKDSLLELLTSIEKELGE